jgi:hypothetical protein
MASDSETEEKDLPDPKDDERERLLLPEDRLADSLVPADVRLTDEPEGLTEMPLAHPDSDNDGGTADSLLPADERLSELPGGASDTKPLLHPERDDGLLLGGGGTAADSLLPADEALSELPDGEPDMTPLLQPEREDGIPLGEDDGELLRLLLGLDGGDALDSLLPADDCGDDDPLDQ